jgi:hypothetical protein
MFTYANACDHTHGYAQTYANAETFIYANEQTSPSPCEHADVF